MLREESVMNVANSFGFSRLTTRGATGQISWYMRNAWGNAGRSFDGGISSTRPSRVARYRLPMAEIGTCSSTR